MGGAWGPSLLPSATCWTAWMQRPQAGVPLTWNGVHSLLLQLREVLQVELQKVVRQDALEFKLIDVGL